MARRRQEEPIKEEEAAATAAEETEQNAAKNENAIDLNLGKSVASQLLQEGEESPVKLPTRLNIRNENLLHTEGKALM